MTMYFAKKLNKKGFTLAELLIVVAIIAVLVAIAIPIFTGALEKARLGVHRSNARALKSMGVSLILGSKDFEIASTGNRVWVVAAMYDFATEKYSDYVVLPVTNDTKTDDQFDTAGDVGKLYVGVLGDANTVEDLTNFKTGLLGDIVGDAEGKLAEFGTHDDYIGKIHTNNPGGDSHVWYAAIITEQDVSGANLTLS